MSGHVPKTALVIGATGGIGGEFARNLLARGWRVRALARNPAEAARRSNIAGPIEWVGGDAMNVADVVAAAAGVDVILHGANPPGYRNWAGLALPMLDSTIAAAKASGARILFPGTIYNYGPDAVPLLSEQSPQNPLTRKGAIRVEMERRLQRAAEAGVRTIIVRAGDFFCPRPGNSWFSQALVTPGKPVRMIVYPGKRDAGHAWAYLPDVAETMARLAEREAECADFDTFHFGGHWFERGTDFAETIRRVAGRPGAAILPFPWPVISLASPFVTLLREMRELRYLWRESVRLDNTKLVAFLGAEPRTPLDDAVRATLAGLGCLDHDASIDGVLSTFIGA